MLRWLPSCSQTTRLSSSFLELELARQYRDAAPATLAQLHQNCEKVGAELAATEDQLRSASNVSALRRAGTHCKSDPAYHESSIIRRSYKPLRPYRYRVYLF